MGGPGAPRGTHQRFWKSVRQVQPWSRAGHASCVLFCYHILRIPQPALKPVNWDRLRITWGAWQSPEISSPCRWGQGGLAVQLPGEAKAGPEAPSATLPPYHRPAHRDYALGSRAERERGRSLWGNSKRPVPPLAEDKHFPWATSMCVILSKKNTACRASDGILSWAGSTSRVCSGHTAQLSPGRAALAIPWVDKGFGTSACPVQSAVCSCRCC